MAAFRWSRVGAGTGAERGGADAPSRSTIETTDPATMATTTVPTATSRAGRRRHLGRAGGAGGWAGGAGSPTQTPNGGGRSGIPPAGDHNRDMTLPPTRPAAQVAGIVVRRGEHRPSRDLPSAARAPRGLPTRPAMTRPGRAQQVTPAVAAGAARGRGHDRQANRTGRRQVTNRSRGRGGVPPPVCRESTARGTPVVAPFGVEQVDPLVFSRPSKGGCHEAGQGP